MLKFYNKFYLSGLKWWQKLYMIWFSVLNYREMSRLLAHLKYCEKIAKNNKSK